MLLSKEEADYFKVDTYDPIGLISKQINDFISYSLRKQTEMFA